MKEDNEVELSVKVKNDEVVEITTYGTGVELLACLALIISALNEDCDIPKSIIKEVVEMELSGKLKPKKNEDKEKTDNKNSEEKSIEEIFEEAIKNILNF